MFTYINIYNRQKCGKVSGDPFTAGSGLLLSGINYFGQQKTNKSNARINAENNRFNAEQAQLQRDFEAAQADLSRQWSTDERVAGQDWQKSMMDYQNEYNSPVNQLKLMRQAGLNPNLWKQDSAVSASPSSVSTPSASVPSGSAAQAAPPISMQNPLHMGNIALESAQARLANAQARNLEEDTRLKSDTHDIHVEEAGVRLALLGFDLNQMKPAEKANLEQQTRTLAKQIDVMNSEIATNEKLADLYDKEGQLKQKELDHFEEQFQAFLAKNASEIRVNNANAKAAIARAAESYAQVAYLKKQGELVDAQTELVKNQSVGQIIQNGLDGLEFTYRSKTNKKEIDLRLAVLDGELTLMPARAEKNKVALEFEADNLTRSKYVNYVKMVPGFILIQAMVEALGYPFGAGVNYSHGSSEFNNVTPQPKHVTVKGFNRYVE